MTEVGSKRRALFPEVLTSNYLKKNLREVEKSRENSSFLPETDTAEAIDADEPGRCDKNYEHYMLHS